MVPPASPFTLVWGLLQPSYLCSRAVQALRLRARSRSRFLSLRSVGLEASSVRPSVATVRRASVRFTFPLPPSHERDAAFIGLCRRRSRGREEGREGRRRRRDRRWSPLTQTEEVGIHTRVRCALPFSPLLPTCPRLGAFLRGKMIVVINYECSSRLSDNPSSES